MTLLSDHSIRKMIDDYDVIEPFHDEQLQPCSYDVALGPTIVKYIPNELEVDRSYVDGRTKSMYCTHKVVQPSEGFMLHPGDFVLASTEEQVSIPNGIACRFEGKSSLGRIGLLTHVTAGFIDPGFYGQITLEITNVNHIPIKLHEGMLIGQLCFYRLDRHADRTYGDSELNSHYQGQMGPTAAR